MSSRKNGQSKLMAGMLFANSHWVSSFSAARWLKGCGRNVAPHACLWARSVAVAVFLL